MKVKTIRTELPPICLLLHLSFWSVALSKHPSPPGTHRLCVLLIRPPSKTQNFLVAARRAAHAMWWQENLWVFQTFHVIIKSQHLQFGWNPVMSIHIRTCWRRAFWGQFSSAAQSCPTLCDPHGPQHARPPCPSPTPGACSNAHPSEVRCAHESSWRRGKGWLLPPGSVAWVPCLSHTSCVASAGGSPARRRFFAWRTLTVQVLPKG